MHALKIIIQSQILASLATLGQCIENCPDHEWNETHHDAPFSQVLFHTLFFLDYYFSSDEIQFKNQVFHIQNKAMFRDYEELIDRKAENIYTRDEIKRYFQFCYEKMQKTFDNANTIDLFEISTHRNLVLAEIEHRC
jgi:hypothetical protein